MLPASAKNLYLTTTILRGDTTPALSAPFGAGAILYSSAAKYPLFWTGTKWDVLAPAPPAAGTGGQVLAKNSGTDYDFTWVTPSNSAANKLLNSSFAFNTGKVVTNVLLAPNAFGFDKWQAGSNGFKAAFTAPAGGDMTLTIAAASSNNPLIIVQTIDPINVEGGTYTLSWTGTALGQVGNNNSFTAYLPSPITVTGVAAGANLQIVLGNNTTSTATLTAPVLTNTSAVVPAVRRLYSEEAVELGIVLPTVNKLINGSFRFNTIGVLSGTVVAANANSFDRWVQGANAGAVSFTTPASGDVTLTFAAASAGNPNIILQTLDAQSMEGGSYTLSWQGTALGQFVVNGNAAAAFAPSPVTITGVTVGQTVQIALGNATTSTATLTTPIVTATATVVPALRRLYSEEKAIIAAGFPSTTTAVNKLLNSSFQLNNGNYQSGTAFTVGMVPFDNWTQSSSGKNVTFTQPPGGGDVTVTLATQTIIAQSVDPRDVEGGSYTVSWGGTAQMAYLLNGTIQNVGGSLYQSSPFTFTCVAGAKIGFYIVNTSTSVTATVTAPMVSLGTIVSPQARRTVLEELAILRPAALPNKLINSSFEINSIGFTSATSLVPGQAVFDKWFATAGSANLGTVNFSTPAGGDLLVTFSQVANAGTPNAFQQTIDPVNVEGGTYTLSWSGTALGSINGSTFAASPITATVAAGGALVIAIGATSTTSGTLQNPILTLGAVVVPAIRRMIGEDRAALGIATPYQNKIVNGGFQVNSAKIATNGVSFATGVGLVDKWFQGPVAGTTSFSTAGGDGTLTTSAAGQYITQTIDPINIEGGTYTLSWQSGQASQGAINVAGAGFNFAKSPITVTGVAPGASVVVAIGYAAASGSRGTTSPVLTNTSIVVPAIRRLINEDNAALGNYAVAQNKILNASYGLNSAGIVSGATFAAGAVLFDRWFMGPNASTVSWNTVAGGDLTINLIGTAGTPNYITQTINAADVEAGSYTLSWKGSGLGAISVAGAATTLAPSPVTVTGVTAGQSLVVQLGANAANLTIVAPVLTLGTQIVSTQRRFLAEESVIINPVTTNPYPNKLLNTSFQFNSATIKTNVSNAANAPLFDKWVMGINPGSLAFTPPAGGDMTLTFPAASAGTPVTILQTVDAGNVEGGNYTLSWAGTAQGQVGVNGSFGTAQGSPIITTGVPAGATLQVQIGSYTAGTKTLTAPVLTNTISVQPAIRRLVNEDFAAINKAALPLFNKLHNPGFTINQRAVAQSGSIAAGTFFADRWKAGSSGALTSTMTAGIPYNMIAFTTGSIVQVMAGEDIEGGVYTVGIMSGAASVRVYTSTSSPGNYVTAPAQYTLVAGQQYYVEYGIGAGGGFTNPYVVLSPYPVTPVLRSYQAEFQLCQRFFQFVPPWGGNWSSATTNLTITGEWLVAMRAAPTLTWKSGSAFNFSTQLAVASSAVASSNVGTLGGYINLTTTGVVGTNIPGAWQTTGIIWASADL